MEVKFPKVSVKLFPDHLHVITNSLFYLLCNFIQRAMLEVCCAIIIREGKMLAVQKGPESSHAWKWEFPGGKVNPLESPEQCIIREIEEELTIRVEVLQRLEAIGFDYGQKPLCLIPFICHITSGEIKLTEHVGMSWIDLKDWDSLDWAEADRLLIQKNKEQLQILLI